MQNKNYVVRIPEPCHEDWNAMQPDEKGRFCSSCSKSVHDFTNKTDAEIHSILIEHKDKQVCGHFRKSQVDRPLNFSIPIHLLPSNLSPMKAFAVALFFVFGTMLFSCTDDKGKEINKIELTDNGERLAGMVMPDIKEIAPEELTIDTVAIQSYTSEVMVNGGIGYNMVDIDSIEPIEVLRDTTYEVPIIDSNTRIYALGGAVIYQEIRNDVIDTTSADTTTLARNKPKDISKEFSFEAYPNPSNGEINIRYEVVKRGNIQIDIYDLTGIRVLNIVKPQVQYEGRYVIPTDLNSLPDGAYICKIINNGIEKTTKIILAK